MASLPPSSPRAAPSSLRVTYGAATTSFPLGKGNQSVRWLASAAAERCRSSKPRGALCVSMSPSSGDLDSFDVAGMPLSLHLVETGELIGPSMSVAELLRYMAKLGPDVLAAGVRVEISTRGALNAHGSRPSSRAPPAGVAAGGGTSVPSAAPLASEPRPLWSALAFGHSKVAQTAAAAQLDTYREEMKRRTAEQSASHALEEAQQIERLSRLLVSDVDDPETIERNFMFDWGNVRTSLVTKSADVAKRLQRDAHRVYLGLSDLFTHFSGGGARGSLYTMQRSELQHLVVTANILDIVKEKKIMERSFDGSKKGRDAGAGGDADSMVRYEFIECLLLMAAEKFGRETDPKTGDEVGPAYGFHRLLNEKLGPLISKLNAGPVRAALRHPDMHRFMLPCMPGLLQVFDYYAAMDADDHTKAVEDAAKARAKAARLGNSGVVGAASLGAGAKASCLMNLSEFIHCLEDAGLLDDVTVMTRSAGMAAAQQQLRNQKATLTAQEVRETFSGVQRDDDGSGIEGDTSADELTFGEFLEALGRVAIAKWGDSVGLKYVLEARQGASKGTPGMGADIFVRVEHTLVRALIMWTYSAVLDLREHLGHGLPAPVQYDVADLVRAVASGQSDVVASSGSRGQLSKGAKVAAAAAEAAAAAAEEAATADPAGHGMAAPAKPAHPRLPFGNPAHCRVPTFAPARPSSAAAAVGGGAGAAAAAALPPSTSPRRPATAAPTAAALAVIPGGGRGASAVPGAAQTGTHGHVYGLGRLPSR